MLEILSTYCIKLNFKGGLWKPWVESQLNDYQVTCADIHNSQFLLWNPYNLFNSQILHVQSCVFCRSWLFLGMCEDMNSHHSFAQCWSVFKYLSPPPSWKEVWKSEVKIWQSQSRICAVFVWLGFFKNKITLIFQGLFLPWFSHNFL